MATQALHNSRQEYWVSWGLSSYVDAHMLTAGIDAPNFAYPAGSWKHKIDAMVRIIHKTAIIVDLAR